MKGEMHLKSFTGLARHYLYLKCFFKKPNDFTAACLGMTIDFMHLPLLEWWQRHSVFGCVHLSVCITKTL